MGYLPYQLVSRISAINSIIHLDTPRPFKDSGGISRGKSGLEKATQVIESAQLIISIGSHDDTLLLCNSEMPMGEKLGAVFRIPYPLLIFLSLSTKAEMKFTCHRGIQGIQWKLAWRNNKLRIHRQTFDPWKVVFEQCCFFHTLNH